MREIVLVLGGDGVFGSRVSMAVARDERVDLIVAGRNRHAASAWSGRPPA